MTKQSLRHFFTNIICGFIYNKDERKRLRVVLNSPILEYIKFIRADTGLRRPRIRTFVGYQARSLVIGVDNKWVYKFPLRRDNYRELANREFRICNAMASISPIKIPSVKLLEYNGMLVRKYEYIPGVSARRMPPELMARYRRRLAAQVARFIYTIGQSDPASICDLKPDVNAHPGYMYGWFQGDIYDNFMIDTRTMKISAFIDWEDATFEDFTWRLTSEKNPVAREFMNAVCDEYTKIWEKNHASA